MPLFRILCKESRRIMDTKQVVIPRTRLSAARERAGFSQEALAEAVEVTRVAVSRWETGDAYPSARNIGALCDTLGVEDPRKLDIYP
jgi:transcriptional regulator with XRE-family HTH domain